MPQTETSAPQPSTPTPTGVRLAAVLPAPRSLVDYDPFVNVGDGTYGVATVKHLSDRSYATVVADLRRAMQAGATVGFAPLTPIKAVFFDMDATVIAEESLVEIAAHAGKSAEVLAITERAMAGELEFKAALTARVGLLAGLSASALPAVAARLTLNRGIAAFVAFCRGMGVPVFMVSGGFTVLAAAVQQQVGFTDVHANVLGVQDGVLTGRVDGPIVDAEGKRDYLLATCARLGIGPHEVAAVGDGANDVPMLQAAGVAVGFQPKPVLLPYLSALNAAGDHGFLGPLLFGRAVPAAGRRGE